MLTHVTRRYWIEDHVRPWTTNSERTWHHYKRASTVKDARERWALLAKAAQVPRLTRIRIDAVPLAKDNRWRSDVGACYPAVKAAIDGLVDAQVIPDDNPKHLDAITFHAPQVVGRDGLRLVISEVP